MKESDTMSTWKNSPDGRILKSDVGVAKNYLEEKAEQEYAIFNRTQKIESDFDRTIKNLLEDKN